MLELKQNKYFKPVIIGIIVVVLVVLLIWGISYLLKAKPSWFGIEGVKNDQDADGLPNEFERDYGLNTEQADSDNDGLSDYDEIYLYQTSPLKADTDGDGYNDKEEIDKGFNPNGEGEL